MSSPLRLITDLTKFINLFNGYELSTLTLEVMEERSFRGHMPNLVDTIFRKTPEKFLVSNPVSTERLEHEFQYPFKNHQLYSYLRVFEEAVNHLYEQATPERNLPYYQGINGVEYEAALIPSGKSLEGFYFLTDKAYPVALDEMGEEAIIRNVPTAILNQQLEILERQLSNWSFAAGNEHYQLIIPISQERVATYYRKGEEIREIAMRLAARAVQAGRYQTNPVKETSIEEVSVSCVPQFRIIFNTFQLYLQMEHAKSEFDIDPSVKHINPFTETVEQQIVYKEQIEALLFGELGSESVTIFADRKLARFLVEIFQAKLPDIGKSIE